MIVLEILVLYISYVISYMICEYFLSGICLYPCSVNTPVSILKSYVVFVLCSKFHVSFKIKITMQYILYSFDVILFVCLPRCKHWQRAHLFNYWDLKETQLRLPGGKCSLFLHWRSEINYIMTKRSNRVDLVSITK